MPPGVRSQLIDSEQFCPDSVQRNLLSTALLQTCKADGMARQLYSPGFPMNRGGILFGQYHRLHE